MICMTHLVRKTLKLLNLTEHQMFLKIRKIAFSVKLHNGLEMFWKLTHDKKMGLFLPVLPSLFLWNKLRSFCDPNIPSTQHKFLQRIFNCRNRRIVKFSENGKLCLALIVKKMALIWLQTDQSLWISGSSKFWLKFRVTPLCHLMH